MQCNAMQCNAMQCNAMQCNAMQCNAMQCNAMQCNTIQYNTIQYDTIQSTYKFEGRFFRHERRIATKFGTHVRIETYKIDPPHPRGARGYLFSVPSFLRSLRSTIRAVSPPFGEEPWCSEWFKQLGSLLYVRCRHRSVNCEPRSKAF